MTNPTCILRIQEALSTNFHFQKLPEKTEMATEAAISNRVPKKFASVKVLDSIFWPSPNLPQRRHRSVPPFDHQNTRKLPSKNIHPSHPCFEEIRLPGIWTHMARIEHICLALDIGMQTCLLGLSLGVQLRTRML